MRASEGIAQGHCLDHNSFRRGERKRLPGLANPRHAGWQTGSLGRVGRRWGRQTRVNQHHQRPVSRHSYHQPASMARRQSTTVQQQKEASLRGTRTTAPVLCWEMRMRRCLRKARHHNLKDNVFRMLKRPIRQDHLVLRLRTKVQWPMIFSELHRPCILYRPRWARKASVSALFCSNSQCSRLVSRRWLQPPRVPPLARRGLRASMRENLGFCCHHRNGYNMEGILTEEELGRVALSCRFALDLLCDKSEQQAVTFSRPLSREHGKEY